VRQECDGAAGWLLVVFCSSCWFRDRYLLWLLRRGALKKFPGPAPLKIRARRSKHKIAATHPFDFISKLDFFEFFITGTKKSARAQRAVSGGCDSQRLTYPHPICASRDGKAPTPSPFARQNIRDRPG
jgi:hypothetical protein